MPKKTLKQRRQGTRTLAIDIGGSGIKTMVLDSQGTPLTDRARVATPRPATPKAVLKAITKLIGSQTQFERVSVGFPGVVRNGVIETAPNLHKAWCGFHLAASLANALKRPVRIANDADVQGFGAIAGSGVELVLTVGTGFGSALFVGGRLVPNLEVAHHRFYRGKTYEELLGNKARKKAGKKQWNKRLAKAIASLSDLFHYDHLYIGGGNTKYIDFDLPTNVVIVRNVAGLIGGITLWQNGLFDRRFARHSAQ